MTTPGAINTHLQTYLPMFTDLFSQIVTVSSASVDASNIITVNAPLHGLNTGSIAVISSGEARNSVNSVVANSDGTATLTTNYDHDLITPSQSLDQKTIVLTGFTPSAWNYEANIIEKIDGTNVIISTSEKVAPTANGYFPGSRNILGFQTVTKIDDDNFSYVVAGKQIPVGTIDNLGLTVSFRMSVSSSVERAEAIYTKKDTNKYALYVVMQDVEVSKSQHTESDLVLAFTPGDFQLIKHGVNFEIIVFAPTDNDLSGSEAEENFYGAIYEALLAVFMGFGLAPQSSAIRYVTGPAGHGPGLENAAYHQHVYSWQAPNAVTIENGFPVQVGAVSVAFNEINQTWNINSDEAAQMTAQNILR